MKIDINKLVKLNMKSCYLTQRKGNNMFDVMFFDEWEQAFSVLEGLSENILNSQREVVRILEKHDYYVQADHIAKMKSEEFTNFVQANLMHF